MIVSTGQVLKVGEWAQRRDKVMEGMRRQIAATAGRRDLLLGNEVVEIVFIRHNGKEWVSAPDALGPNPATHVKVVVEVQAEHA